jgi:hypothetical protein
MTGLGTNNPAVNVPADDFRKPSRQMEKNTFATSAYIAAPYKEIIDYLGDLRNLNEWTLFSRMQSQVDESTWIGTASGYQRLLYYHAKEVEYDKFQGIEWHCGFDHGVYHQVFPVLVFPTEYVHQDEEEPGAYLHWVSFIDPARRTPMIEQGISVAHTAECRALKAILERRAGQRYAARGCYAVQSETIYVDAPTHMGVDYVADVRNMEEYSFLLRPYRDIDAAEGQFVDEYGRRVTIHSRKHSADEVSVVEHNAVYPDDGGFAQRLLTLVIPCSYAFGQPAARGFIKHRVTFRPADERQTPGRGNIDDLRAESINMKRMLEAKAGNLETFARGFSYLV